MADIFTYHGAYAPGRGHFSLATVDLIEKEIKNNHYYYHCREEFHSHFNQDSEFILFSHDISHIKHFQKFFNIIEEKLNIKLDINKTIFYPTTNKNVILVKVGKFWRKNGKSGNKKVRSQLFTILLRAARKFDENKNNFEEAIYKNKYMKSEKSRFALDLFLSGRTKSAGIKVGSTADYNSNLITHGWNYWFVKRFGNQKLNEVKEIIEAGLVN